MNLKNEIYCGDNAELIKSIPDESIDLTVTSPPYDNLRTYKGYTWDFETIAKELYRVTKDGGVVVWVVGDATIKGSETGTSFRQALYFKDECGFNLHDTMIYKTNKPPYNDNRYNSIFEYMFIFVKNKIKTFNPIKIFSLHPGVKSYGGLRAKNGKMKKRQHNKKTPVEKKRDNVWYMPRSSLSGDVFSRKHPATFPEALARDHIISWSNPGDLVFDPFAGSGTTLKMAMQCNRYYLGFEISQEYIDIINERLRQKCLFN